MRSVMCEVVQSCTVNYCPSGFCPHSAATGYCDEFALWESAFVIIS